MGTKGNLHNNNAGSESDSDSRRSEKRKGKGKEKGRGALGAARRFAVTASGGAGLKLRIAALPPPAPPPAPPSAPPAAAAPLPRLRGRRRPEVGVAVGCASSSSSSSASASSSSSSSSSDSDSGDSAGGSANASSDDSSAALAAACSLQVIDDEDLAALLPEGGQPAAVVPVAAAAPFAPPFVAPSPQHLDDDKSIQDTGDGSSSEMEIPAQLVTAAIQRATADSSGSENECSDRNAGGPSATHYASSLLRQFVAQTQLLNHSASMNHPGAAQPVAANLPDPPDAPDPPAETVADLHDCMLPPPDFLADEHLTAAAGRHLSPQQTEELRLINKDLAEIVSHANPADRATFANIDVSDSGSAFAKGEIKSSPAPSTEEAAPSRMPVPPDAHDGDVKRKRGRPRKTKEPLEDRGGSFPKEEKAAPPNEAIAADEFCLGADDPPNVSPDSGILSNHNSPARSPVGKPERKKEATAEPARRRSASRRRRVRSRSRPRDGSLSSEASLSFGRKTPALPPPPPALKVETPSPTPCRRRERVKKSDAKLDIAALDRMLYATDRVLYPPRRKAAKGARGVRGRPLDGDSADSDGEMTANRSVLSEAYAKRKDLNKLAASTRKGGRDLDDWRDRRSDAEGPADDALDPTWRQIDLNPRFRDVLSGYRSDRDVKPYKSCSRLIESGYRSECGFRGGYRSDRGCRSGYKTDHRSGYRSDKSGYKSDRSVRSVRGGRKRMRKMKKSRSVRDRTYYKNQKYFVTDREILLLANKTFSCLTLGRGESDSDSDSDYRSGRREVKFASACAKFRSLSVGADFGFGACGLFASASSERPSASAPDPFAPGPVFGAFNARIPTSTINANLFQSSNSKPLFSEPHEHMFGGSPALGRSPVFAHKFARSPILADGKDDPDEATPKGDGDTPKRARSLRPEQKRSAKAADAVPARKTDKSPVVIADAFRKARNAYVPSETLARNVFLNVRSPLRKSPASHEKKRRKRLGVGVVVSAAGPTAAVTVGAAARPSRAPAPPARDDRRRRHRAKRRRPSRSLSRPRDASVKRGADAVDPGFAEEVDGLSSRFAELCRVAAEAPPPAGVDRDAVVAAPAAASESGGATTPATVATPATTATSATAATPAAAAPSKSAKRASKKRKASDLADAPPPASKRRHKKQPAECSSRGDDGNASANEHKLPLKKRHYHVNRSAAAGVASESVEGLEAGDARPADADADADAFECTETDCLADRPLADADASSSDSDVKLQISKTTGETSELSKKIYETSERPKAAHRPIHDLEKSLPKTEEIDGEESKTENAGPESSPLGSKSLSAPIVTPKKRHRLEADRAVPNSPLDQVVQSLTKKLSEDRGISLDGDGSENKSDRCAPLRNQESDGKKSSQTDAAVTNDPIKSLSSRNLHKTPTVCVQKSDIMTRKKIRLEGLTSNLVSKINPNGATKTFDNSINNNLRKSIESRMSDKSKESIVESGHKSQEEKSKARKDNSGSTPRATVIKSPISRQKLPAEAKKLPKGTEILIEETVVVEVEKPTGIFEPSVDIEMQIPKSSISLSGTTELFGKNHRATLNLQKLDGKNHLKFTKENDIPPVLAESDLSPRKRSESIASLICDKIQESGHNLRQSKRSGLLDSDKKLEECASEKKKKKPSNILRESKLSVICPQTPPPKILPEKMNPVVDIKKSDIENVALKCLENAASDGEKSVPLKKRVKRRKTINRTGFPSIKKKKKKISLTSSAIPSSQLEANVNSAFERVPEDGEATDRFVERTTKLKPAELKIVLKKEDYPKRSRLSVISLERLQGKRSSEMEKKEEPAPAEDSEDIDSDMELHLLGKTITKRIPEETKPRLGARKAVRKATPPSRETSVSSGDSSSSSTCSRETSVDTLDNFRDRCEDPLPLNEKEVDFEKSIDGLSKSIINKRRAASSRDDSPASSVDGFKTADKDRMKRNPRLRKKYLVAGLFSDYYKQNELKPVDPKGRFNINLKDFPNGLLAPPPYCERWIRQRKRHFQLPYDVWWQRRYNQTVPSWNYRKIRTNVYYDVKPSAYGCESQACNCVPSSGCPDDCINRLVYSECTSQLCPCRELCKNQRIQKHDWSPGLEKFMTQSKGWGVRTKLPIKSGEFILEYVGEVVSDKEFKERMAWRYARDTHHYCLHLDGGLVIDGHRMGGDGRFVNHSCLPNCEMQKWSANGTFRMALFALRDIRGGEELTYDYNFSLFNPAEGQPCKCESNNCRGVIGGKSQRVPVKQSSLKSQPKAPAVSQIATSTSNATGVWNPSTNRVGRPRKAVQAKKAEGRDARTANLCEIKKHVVKYQQQLSRLYQEPQMKPLTAREKTIARETHCFLLKNLNKVRRIRDRTSMIPRISGAGNVNGMGSSLPGNVTTSIQVEKPSEKPSRPSSRKPRSARKASAPAPVDDRSCRLTAALKDIYDAVVAPNDEKSVSLCKPLLLRQVPERDSSVLKCPPNLVSIRAVIDGGHYTAVSHFDTDMNALFSDVVRTDGRLSVMGLAALHLKKIYNAIKPKFAERLTEIIGPDEILPAGFAPKKKQEEVIMCICGLHLEEGLMVQCVEEREREGKPREREREKEASRGCGVWQHAHCMGVTDTRRPFLCHRCQPREINLEIPLDEYAEEGHRFYLSLMRGDLQVRQGDTVYVLRDIPIDEKRPDVSKQTNADTHTSSGSGRRSDAKKRPSHNKDASKETSAKNKGTKPDKKNATKETYTSKTEDRSENTPKHTYKTIGDIAVSELDIFRVERLWKHKDTGERFVYGHHYLRPHETYHEPTRKFFPNEVMRVPLYEAVPIDLVMSQCWVLDVNTYCKGRPVGAVEEHVYISELRVDRGARLFTKISRPKYPVCTKSYAFDTFPQRLKISRTYAPHEVSPEFLKGRGRVADKDKPKKEKENKLRPPESDAGKRARREPDRHPAVRILPSPQMPSQNRDMQKSRLNGILLRLLGRLPTKRPLDVSYLLDGRRQRKKMQSS